MDHKKTLIALAAIFTLVNTSIVLGANEPYKSLYSAFGSEDPDADLDGVSTLKTKKNGGEIDKCPGTPFDLYVINQYNNKTNRLPLALAGKDGTAYLRLRFDIGTPYFEVSKTEDFSEKERINPSGSTIIAVTTLNKRLRILYSNVTKGVAIIWLSDLPGKQPGCSVSEER